MGSATIVARAGLASCRVPPPPLTSMQSTAIQPTLLLGWSLNVCIRAMSTEEAVLVWTLMGGRTGRKGHLPPVAALKGPLMSWMPQPTGSPSSDAQACLIWSSLQPSQIIIASSVP